MAEAEPLQITAQGQVEGRYVEAQAESGGVTSEWQLAPLYTLGLQGPVAKATHVLLDIGVTGYSSADPRSAIDQRDYRANLVSNGSIMSLLATAHRGTSRVSYVGDDGLTQSLGQTTDSYVVTASLRPSRFPDLSFQYSATSSRAPDEGTTTSSNWLLAAGYDWRALRLTADLAAQMSGGQSSRRQQYGVSFMDDVGPTIRVALDHYTTLGLQSAVGAPVSSSRNGVTTARLSASPTPYIAFEGRVSLATSASQTDGAVSEGFTNINHSLALRSEVRPNVRLDIQESGNRSVLPGSIVRSDRISADLTCALWPTTTLMARWNRATSVYGADTPEQSQDDVRLSFSSQPEMTTSIYGEWGFRRQAYQDLNYGEMSASLGVRRELSATLSLGGSYRYAGRVETRAGVGNDDTTHSLQVDGSWSPDPRWTLGFGAGAAARLGTRPSFSIAPRVDVRWDGGGKTSVSVGYRSQLFREDDPDSLDPVDSQSRTSTGFTGRIEYRISDREAAYLSYDVNRGYGDLLSSRKMLQLTYSRTF